MVFSLSSVKNAWTRLRRLWWPNKARQRCALNSVVLHLDIDTVPRWAQNACDREKTGSVVLDLLCEYGSTEARAQGLVWARPMLLLGVGTAHTRVPSTRARDWVQKATLSACARATACGALAFCRMTSIVCSEAVFGMGIKRMPPFLVPRTCCTYLTCFRDRLPASEDQQAARPLSTPSNARMLGLGHRHQ